VSLRRKKLWEQTVEVSLQEKVEKKGKYFVIVWAPPVALPADIRAGVADLVRRYKDESFQKTVDAEEDAVDGDKLGSDGDSSLPAFMQVAGAPTGDDIVV
jgi:hypothetical protein